MASPRLSLAVVVAAAGYGTRLDAGVPKQYVPLLGVPLIRWTLSALSSCPLVDAIVVVVNEADLDYCRSELRLERIDRKILRVVGGGDTRPASVRNGLAALTELGKWGAIGVHDGARPLVACRDIEAAMARLLADETLDGVILGARSADTIKTVDRSGIITATPDRRLLWRAQTPQVFRPRAILEAYAAFDNDELERFTDDAGIVEARGGRVMVVEGSSENFKITDRDDFRLAERILLERQARL